MNFHEIFASGWTWNRKYNRLQDLCVFSFAFRNLFYRKSHNSGHVGLLQCEKPLEKYQIKS